METLQMKFTGGIRPCTLNLGLTPWHLFLVARGCVGGKFSVPRVCSPKRSRASAPTFKTQASPHHHGSKAGSLPLCDVLPTNELLFFHETKIMKWMLLFTKRRELQKYNDTPVIFLWTIVTKKDSKKTIMEKQWSQLITHFLRKDYCVDVRFFLYRALCDLHELIHSRQSCMSEFNY